MSLADHLEVLRAAAVRNQRRAADAIADATAVRDASIRARRRRRSNLTLVVVNRKPE
jgi:hypothetical protein